MAKYKRDKRASPMGMGANGDRIHMGALPPEFRKAVDVPAYQAAQVQYGAIDPETESIRHLERQKVREEKVENYNISTMDTAEAASTGKVATNVGANALAKEEAKRTEKRARNNMDLQAQLAALRDYERGLEGQYGENFALDLVGDLVEDGHFTDDDYKRFAAIEDPDERRRAIAAAIQEKIDAGEIDPANLKDHPWALEWLDKHEEARIERDRQAELARDGKLGMDEITLDAQDEVKRDAAEELEQTAVEAVSIADHQASESVQDTGFSFGSGGMSL